MYDFKLNFLCASSTPSLHSYSMLWASLFLISEALGALIKYWNRQSPPPDFLSSTSNSSVKTFDIHPHAPVNNNICSGSEIWLWKGNYHLKERVSSCCNVNFGCCVGARENWLDVFRWRSDEWAESGWYCWKFRYFRSNIEQALDSAKVKATTCEEPKTWIIWTSGSEL